MTRLAKNLCLMIAAAVLAATALMAYDHLTVSPSHSDAHRTNMTRFRLVPTSVRETAFAYQPIGFSHDQEAYHMVVYFADGSAGRVDLLYSQAARRAQIYVPSDNSAPREVSANSPDEAAQMFIDGQTQVMPRPDFRSLPPEFQGAGHNGAY